MPIEPADHLHHVYSILAEQSPLLKASYKLLGSAPVSPAAGPSQPASPSLNISTSDIIRLFQRFQVREMTFDQLLGLPLSQLTPTEKSFVLYLRQNRYIFEQIARLDHHPESLSPEDVKIAAQLAGDSLVLSEEDLKYLRSITEPPPAPTSGQPIKPPDHPIEADRIIAVLGKTGPEPFSLQKLTTLQPEALHLANQEREVLDFMQSRPVQRILKGLTQSTNGILTPEVIRTLTSLIWNPAIYSALPMVFLKEPRPLDDEDISDISAVTPITPSMDEEDTYLRRSSRLHVELHAAKITEVCRKLNPHGPVTLEQLRAYEPADIEEARVVNTLKQVKIFNVLADMDADPDTLSAKDIRIAVSAGTIMVYDPYIMLIILP